MIAQPIAHPTFDTLKFAQKLKAAGMPEPQAIALTEAQNEALMESTDQTLATKADLFDVKQELKQEIADLRQGFNDLKSEVSGIKSTLKHHGWMIGLGLSGIGFVLSGIVVLIFKTFFP